VAPEGRDRPKLSDAELLTLAVMQVLLGHANETGWLRYANEPFIAPVPVPTWSGRIQQTAT